MLSTSLTRKDAFVPLPSAPAGATPDLAASYAKMAHGFVADDDNIIPDWSAGKEEILAFPCRRPVDLATKIMTAMHDIGAQRRDGVIGYDPGDFPTDISLQLLASCVNDALALEVPTPNPHFIRILIEQMRANFMSFTIEPDGLRTWFPEPGVAGRPERSECLDNIDGAMRALYALMNAVPGATEAVKAALRDETATAARQHSEGN